MATATATATDDEVASAHAIPEKLAYRAPALVYHGDIRAMTLGISTGLADSGNERVPL